MEVLTEKLHENTYRSNDRQGLPNVYQNLPPFQKWAIKH